ncbi:MAG: ABC transporter permease, partial [Proteobacteria bacterium]|nr:ABC transporter permease [Pseudomonadota bacterium]
RAPALVAFLQRQQVTVLDPPLDYEKKVKVGDLDIVLEIDAEFEVSVAKGEPGVIHLIYDRSRDRALPFISELERLLRSYSREWGGGRLLLRGMSASVANPLSIEVRDLSTPQSSGVLVLFLIAYYGLFATVMGGMAAAVDTTAGERERASLEPLLTTAVQPLELAVGKWASIVVLNASTVTLTILGFYLILRFAPLPAVGIPFLFGLGEVGKFYVVLAPLITLMPAAFLYLGARARSFKEAQSNVALLLFVVSMLPIVQMFLQKKEPTWLNWVPISGQYGLLSRALRGDTLLILELLQSYATPLFLTLAALIGVAQLFARESALAGNP